MGFLNFFESFKKKEPRQFESKEGVTIELTVGSESDDAEDFFGTPTEFVRAAFDQIMEKVEVDDDLKERLFEAYLAAHHAGSPRDEKMAVETHLAGTNWRWSWLDEWIERFNSENEWPPMYFEYRKFFEETGSEYSSPTKVSEALYLFNVKELRAWLKENNIKVGTCKRRQELEKAMIEAVPWDRFRPAALKRYEANKVAEERMFREKKEKARCDLLAISITALAYKLRRHNQGNEIRGWFWIVKPDDSSFARAAAKSFNDGLSEMLPPYYPGDGSYLKHIRKKA